MSWTSVSIRWMTASCAETFLSTHHTHPMMRGMVAYIKSGFILVTQIEDVLDHLLNLLLGKGLFGPVLQRNIAIFCLVHTTKSRCPFISLIKI